MLKLRQEVDHLLLIAKNCHTSIDNMIANERVTDTAYSTQLFRILLAYCVGKGRQQIIGRFRCEMH
jgi:hypothetical protein